MDGGFRDSPIRLNRSLANLEHWDKEQINHRAEKLADTAITIWTAPSLPAEILNGYRASGIRGSRVYSIEDHTRYLHGMILDVFQQFRTRVLNLDPSIQEEFTKRYIAYKTFTSFVEVQPQENALRVTLNAEFSEIDDPQRLATDITGVEKVTNGNVEVHLASQDQLEDVLELVEQSFELHREDGSE